ncbi:MAG: ClpXP protease specificity-enhancing factor SspB [Mariprofundus sp.]|nr:ClpXP protease specificity-enhancing factor SspB [Mariprofundus sp.]
MSLSFSDAAKAKKLREYFNRHGRIYIVVDATQDDVLVPESLSGDPALRLVLNIRMPQIIHIHDDRIDSDFSFSGQTFSCKIPMHTIWAAYLPEGELEQGIIWDDSVPEMIKAIVQAVRSNMSDEGVQELHDNKTKLSSVEDASMDALSSDTSINSTITVIEGGGQGKVDDGDKVRKKNHLRVVK